MFTRRMGRSGIEVSALGLGCWAIGGPFYRNGKPLGWGEVNDDESIRALERALELGVNFFDTADVYGCGHSERLLGKAFHGKRDQVVLATKVGWTYDEETRESPGQNADPAYIKRSCEASLRRLNTDVIDLYQFHLGRYEPENAAEVRDVMEDLVSEGKIRWYGWSTDNPEGARVFAQGENCTSIQQRFNIFEGDSETLKVCEDYNLASINRGPLAMGLLTGKFNIDTTFPEDDVRCDWDFKSGNQGERLRRLEDIRQVLQCGGRTLAQAALGWLWVRSDATIPIPGFKSVGQVEENARAAQFGPLDDEVMEQISRLLEE